MTILQNQKKQTMNSTINTPNFLNIEAQAKKPTARRVSRVLLALMFLAVFVVGFLIGNQKGTKISHFGESLSCAADCNKYDDEMSFQVCVSNCRR